MVLSLTLTLDLCAQIKIVPRDRLEMVANPRLSSDSASLQFDARHIIAEKMHEDDEPKNFKFRFRNIGDAPISIKRITSSCSCAAATCSKTEIRPGEVSEINVRYNPKGHPGRFDRTIFVYSKEGNEPAAVLKLTVEVSHREDGSGLYPVEMGIVRLRRSSVTFQSGEKAVERIPFKNQDDKPLRLECNRMMLPQCLDFHTEPQILQAGAEGEIVITFDPLKGKVRERMTVILEGIGVPPSQASVKVDIKK